MATKPDALRKITLRNCGWNMAAVKKTISELNGEDYAPLLRVAGIVTSHRPGSTQLGEYLKLFGQIRAVNMETGESFSANQMILPNFISEGLAATLAQAGAGGDAEFALEIGARTDETSVTGYVYVARNLIESKVSDRMQKLIESASAGMPAPRLPAPEKAAKAAKAAKRASK